MRQITEFSINEVHFTSYDNSDKEWWGRDLHNLDFDGRHDFVFDEDLAGIAAQIDFYNGGFASDRGVRRQVEFKLIDQDDRIPVFTLTRQIRIPSSECFLEYILDLSAKDIDFRDGHAYRLVVRDLTMESVLGEYFFRLFSRKQYGSPKQWYVPIFGGVCTPDYRQYNKSLKVEPYRRYMVSFAMKMHMGLNRPAILPEVEIHLYCTVSGKQETAYVEPCSIDWNEYRVNMEFCPGSEDFGAYYAELLCMGESIAGFVFDTTVNAEMCGWSDSYLSPIGRYEPEKVRDLARWRLKEYMPEEEVMSGNLSLIEDKDEASTQPDEEVTVAEDHEPGEKDPEPETAPKPSLEEALSVLTGLDSVKSKLLDYEKVVRFNKMRSDCGLPVVTMPLHTMFLGSPGTGKTTVANMLGDLLCDVGMLSRGHVVVRERATLLGQYYSSEAEKTLEALDEAQGGILFIDEAYQLYKPNDPRDPGHFVIDTLLTKLSDESNRDWMLILAGYPEPMLKMLECNPGFKSRMPASNIYRFEDFTSDQLIEIAHRYLRRSQYALTPEADEALIGRLMADYAHRDRVFGNARHVMNLIQSEILPAMAKRVLGSDMTDESVLTDITAADIPPYAPHISQTMAQRIGYAC